MGMGSRMNLGGVGGRYSTCGSLYSGKTGFVVRIVRMVSLRALGCVP